MADAAAYALKTVGAAANDIPLEPPWQQQSLTNPLQSAVSPRVIPQSDSRSIEMRFANLLNRLANEWSILGILAGFFMGLIYKGFTQDPVRAWLYGAVMAGAGILIFNFWAFYIFSDAYEEGLFGVFQLVSFQMLTIIGLTVLIFYAVARLPFTPTGIWTSLKPAPEKLVELVDTPLANDWAWAVRAVSEQQNSFIYGCHHRDECQWYSEYVFFEQDWGEVPFNFDQCQRQHSDGPANTPRKPPGVIDTFTVYQCGGDITLAHHLILTQDGTVWYWMHGSTSLTVVGLLYLTVLIVILLSVIALIISFGRLLEYRYRVRQKVTRR